MLPIAPVAGGNEGTPPSGSTDEAGAKESSRTNSERGSERLLELGRRGDRRQAVAESEAPSGQDGTDGRLLGVVLLLLTLGSGGWAASRAFSD